MASPYSIYALFPLRARHRLWWLQVKDSWGQAFAFARHDVIEGVTIVNEKERLTFAYYVLF